tara:strand:- start:7427 stop:8131 length:705 start_codon:yes stop_codon:yes gene_type:complete
MSIVALKRKSKSKYSKISHNKGFSLNSDRHQRSSSFVGGSSSFNNTVNRTRFKGSEPIGYGSCCGKYNRNIINSNYCCNPTPETKYIRQSVKNTKGYLSRKNVWLTGGYPKFVYQSQSINDYERYNSKISSCNACKNRQNENSGENCKNLENKCTTSQLPLNMSGVKRTNLNINNYQKTVGAISQGEYITTDYKCNNCLPPPPDKREYPPPITNKGCYVKVSSQEEAIAMGLYK